MGFLYSKNCSSGRSHSNTCSEFLTWLKSRKFKAQIKRWLNIMAFNIAVILKHNILEILSMRFFFKLQ